MIVLSLRETDREDLPSSPSIYSIPVRRSRLSQYKRVLCRCALSLALYLLCFVTPPRIARCAIVTLTEEQGGAWRSREESCLLGRPVGDVGPGRLRGWDLRRAAADGAKQAPSKQLQQQAQARWANIVIIARSRLTRSLCSGGVLRRCAVTVMSSDQHDFGSSPRSILPPARVTQSRSSH